MDSTARSQGYVAVTSAMRTGSTWLVGILQQISQTQGYFVHSADEVRQLMATRSGGGVIKTHQIIDLDWPKIPEQVPIVRLTRNYKDSVLSRILYVKNIRAKEGASAREAQIRDLEAKLGPVSDLEFVQAFVDESSMVKKWLAEIVVLERGEDARCHTLMYEMLMHNPYDALAELTETLWPGCQEAMNRVGGAVMESIRDGYKKRKTFLRAQAVGVGGWETWLTCEQSEKLDAMYFKMRAIALGNPDLRWQGVLKEFRAGEPQAASSSAAVSNEE